MGARQSSLSEQETRRLNEERRRLEDERRHQEERHRQQQLDEERRIEEARRRKQQLDLERRLEQQQEEEQFQLRKVKREAELKSVEYKHVEELEKIKDREKERKCKLEELKEKNKHERSLEALELLKQNFSKVQDFDLNYGMCTGQLVESVANGSPLDTSTFHAIASKVPAALPSKVNLTQLVENVIQQVEEEERECGID